MSDKYDYYEITETSDGTFKVIGRKHGEELDNWAQLFYYIIKAIIKLAPVWKVLGIIMLVGTVIALPFVIITISSQPVDLTKLDTIESSNMYVIEVADSFNNIGDKHTPPVYYLPSYIEDGQLVKAYANIAINGKYSYLEGTVSCDDDQHPEDRITLLIYADGKLVYSSGELSTNSELKQFKINIENVSVVRIESYCNYDKYEGAGFGQPSIILDAECHKGD